MRTINRLFPLLFALLIFMSSCGQEDPNVVTTGPTDADSADPGGGAAGVPGGSGDPQGGSGSGGGGSGDSGGGTGISPDATGGGIGGSGDGQLSGGIVATLVGRYAPGLEALTVTVESVELHMISPSETDDGEWVLLFSDPQDYDILQLIDGVEAELANETFDMGSFDKSRVQLSDATVDVDGVTSEMSLTGGGQSIVQSVEDLIVEDGVTTLIRLDFDPVQSVKLLGNGSYQLNPDLTLVEDDLTGDVTGSVEPLGIGAELGVFNEQNEKFVAAAAVRDDGTFTIPRLHTVDETGEPIQYLIHVIAEGYESQTFRDVAAIAGEEFALDHILLLPLEENETDCESFDGWVDFSDWLSPCEYYTPEHGNGNGNGNGGAGSGHGDGFGVSDDSDGLH